MPERYAEAILKYLAAQEYQPLKPRQLARLMGVADEDYGSFRTAVKELHDSGRIVMGAKDSLVLPDIPPRVVGTFRANPRGFGFIVPQTPNSHGDLFIPPDSKGGAMDGDLVVARVIKGPSREGRQVFSGQIVEIIQRGTNRFVGSLECVKGAWFVMPDGKQLSSPIVIRDISEASPAAGTKVVVEIIQYGKPEAGELPVGVIVESLGSGGELEVETMAVIRAHGLADKFGDQAMNDARAAIAAFDPDSPSQIVGREDITGQVVVTIDPPDARDFDDAMSLRANPDSTCTLGVHIADVSYFVREGTELDTEARARATSTYFPRKVVPMLPEVLSNGVCSLQEGVRRFCKSAFITYDKDGNRLSTRFAETVIASHKRLNYIEAQGIIDGAAGGYDPEVVQLLKDSDALARRIEARRRRAGMLHLDLPEVVLVLDDKQHVVDATPADDSYTHTLIEMFMVEANEVVAELFDRLDRPCLRRIHPDPDMMGGKQLSAFVRACGHKISVKATRRELQDLLAAVKGKPESFAVNLAVLKTFEQAEYSPRKIGHFALASHHYCHFTSPIRRYPDLTVHRLLADYVQGKIKQRPPEDMSALVQLADHCSAAERRSEAAEDELRNVLVLQMLVSKVGEGFDGVVTGIANFGIFVQLPRFLIDGLVRLHDLGDDWWDISPQQGQVRGQRTGQTFRVGDVLPVRIAAVDVARRQLNLVLQPKAPGDKGHKPAKGGEAPRRGNGRPPRGKRGAAPETGQPQHGKKGKKTNKRSPRRGKR